MQGRGLKSVRLAGLFAVLAALLLPPSASAADTVYWASENGQVQYGNLDGTGTAHNLFSGEGAPCGVAVDPASGQIYWANFNSSEIRVGNLDGTGPTTLISGAASDRPCGVAVDPATSRIYWADTYGGTIWAADLTDVSGTAETLVSGETFPTGVAIDPAGGKIYWANQAPFGGSGAIRGANLDGSSPATLVADSRPIGVAVDPAAGQIYWASYNDGAIRRADLNGLDPATAVTDLVSGQNGPAGLAIDPGANKLYWADFTSNSQDSIWSASLEGTSPAQLFFLGTSFGSNFPALLKAPVFADGPAISGGAKTNRELTCEADFAPDLLGAFLYRAPAEIHYQWKQDGSNVGTDSDTFAPTEAGDYTCTVTASNQAGSTEQTSAVKKVKESNGKGPK